MKTNPKLLEIFGEESRPLFAGLIVAIGVEAADTFYVVTDARWSMNGVQMPRYLRSKSANADSVERRINNYVYNATGDGDAEGIDVFNTVPMDGDIKLCLNY